MILTSDIASSTLCISIEQPYMWLNDIKQAKNCGDPVSSHATLCGTIGATCPMSSTWSPTLTAKWRKCARPRLREAHPPPPVDMTHRVLAFLSSLLPPPAPSSPQETSLPTDMRTLLHFSAMVWNPADELGYVPWP